MLPGRAGGRVRIHLRPRPLDPETLVRAAGGGLTDVVKVSAILASIERFHGFNATYERIFDTMSGPARTTTLRDILVEIEVVLHLPRP